MPEIKCPKCGEVFQVDESGYTEILAQVRNAEFKKELDEKLKSFNNEKNNAVQIAKLEEKEKAKNDIAEKEAKIKELEQKIENAKTEQQLAVGNEEHKSKEIIAQKETLIKELEQKLKNAETEQKLAVETAVSKVEKERDYFINQLDSQKKAQEFNEQALKQKYEEQLRFKNEEIERYKDFKQRQSTKLLGESLEQHCQVEFDRLRATAFQNSYFEKDNDISRGSKGDYIFRDYDGENNEIVSIMFEMKNQQDETATKKKNEDFFKKLDKDRNDKNCEYAVLVSMLEPDSELYNTGIVDVSYRYPKMYVIRPQFFIPIITVLRNAALNSMEYKRELSIVRNQNIDITNFEQNLMDFKDSFSKNYKNAHDRFNDAIKEIDKSIDHLKKIRDNLTKSDSHLRVANNKIEDISIKKLTKGNPTMEAKFEELKKNDNE